MMKEPRSFIGRDGVAYLQVIFACIAWGTYGVFVQRIDHPPEVIVFFRFFFGAIILFFMASFMGTSLRIQTPGVWQRLALLGFINTVSWLALTQSISLTTVATGFTLYYTAPCFVVLFSAILLRERVESRVLLALLLCFIGIIFVMGVNSLRLGESWQGSALGLASGIFYAGYIIGLKRLPWEVLGIISNSYVCAVIALITFPMAMKHFGEIPLESFLVFILMAVLIQGVGTTMYMVGLRRIKAQNVSILSYLEALFAVLFAALLLGEAITLGIAFGGLLIAFGGFMVISTAGRVGQSK